MRAIPHSFVALLDTDQNKVKGHLAWMRECYQSYCKVLRTPAPSEDLRQVLHRRWFRQQMVRQ
eukprot:11211713-Lingulodinium_polyedra.AAC.1